MEAVILAGGRGTRLRPLTDTHPKPLVAFMGEPFALGLLRRLAEAGATRASFLVGQDTRPWVPLVDRAAALGVEVSVFGEEEALDTAGSARRLFNRGVDGPVLVANGDILTDLDLAGLVAHHRRAAAAATLALTRVEDTSAFGVVVCDPQGRIERFVEKPPSGTVPADTVNAGTYVLSPDVFEAFPGDGPLSFERVVFPGLLAAGRLLVGVVADAYWQDLGTPGRYLRGHAAVLEGRCRWPVPDDMVVRDGAAVHVAADVHADVELASAVVGARCRVGSGARLDAAVLHEGVHVGARAAVREAILGPGSQVEAGAIVPPGTVLGDGVRWPDDGRGGVSRGG